MAYVKLLKKKDRSARMKFSSIKHREKLFVGTMAAVNKYLFAS